MNLMERTIAAVMPRYAVRRAAARVRLRYLETGGSADWGRNTGRVQDALPQRVIGRRRVLQALAMNPYAVKAKTTLLNNLVGFGIIGTPKAPKKVIAEWKRFVKRADWMGRHDLYGLQDLAVGTEIGEGEVFIVRRFDAKAWGAGRGMGTRLQVLDAGMLNTAHASGPIDYDDHGRPTQYHFVIRRPGEPGAGVFGKTETIAAEHVIHLYRQDWPGQLRGRSMFEPVIKRYEDLDEYIDAENVRKKIEACFVGFIQPSIEVEGADLGKVQDGERSDNGFELETFEPGMLERLNPGETVTFGDPKPSVGMAEFARVTLLGATAGVSVPYEHGTGDLSNVNYSSYRAGSLEFQRFCGRKQWLQIIPVMLDRVWEWFLQDGWQAGVFARNDYEIEWTPPAFESIDREKEAKADAAEIEAGLNSRRKLVGARGYDLDELDAEIERDSKGAQARGLKFKGDPLGAAAANPSPGNTGGDNEETTDDDDAAAS
jgi:lambda family phage portal protein